MIRILPPQVAALLPLIALSMAIGASRPGLIPTDANGERLRPDIRIKGVQILVSDMNEAIEFYTGVVGFGIAAMEEYPAEVLLDAEGLELRLVKTEYRARSHYSGTVRTTFGFQANDLLATRNRLEKAGVDFIEPEPVQVGVGIATTFHDPFGNVIYLLEQQVGEVEPFDEPRIYNVGYHIRDATAGRAFYSDVLGFVVRSERYFPAIPLGHQDGSFAFMLHEKSDLKPHAASYPDEAQVVIRFETDDLATTAEMIRAAGAVILRGADDQPSGVMAVRDPLGNVFEIQRTEQSN